ncbi:hypothetical protein HanIR_Chr04g0198101 [Helianthus annuus]|nr:hypothetical protein HanIR_Chr04g0198101 [Helianthus annuus]
MGGGYGTIYKAQSKSDGTTFVVKCKELSIQLCYAFFGSTMSIDKVLFMMQMYSVMPCLLPLTTTNSSYHLPAMQVMECFRLVQIYFLTNEAMKCFRLVKVTQVIKVFRLVQKV